MADSNESESTELPRGSTEGPSAHVKNRCQLAWVFGGYLILLVATSLGVAAYRLATSAAEHPTASSPELAGKTLSQLALVAPGLAAALAILALPSVAYTWMNARAVRLHSRASVVLGLLPTGACVYFVSVPPVPANAQVGIGLFVAGGLTAALYAIVLLAVGAAQLVNE